MRIFQRNHLLDFVKISKYFKVRSGKRRAHEGLSTGRSRTTRRLRIFQRNHLLDFVKISKYFKVRSGKRRPMKVSRLAGRERLADCGSSSVITFWTLSKFQNISPAGRVCASLPVGRDAPIEGLSTCSGRERGSSSVIFWTFDKVSKGDYDLRNRRIVLDLPVEKYPPIGLSRPAGRERTRRLRIFQRNHLLDFVKISKYFKVRSVKVSRLAFGSLIKKFQNISRSVVGRDSPIGVLSLCSVQTDLPIADVPA